MLPDSYTAVHRYSGAILQRDQRDQISDCCMSDRDIAIVHDVWRYRFLTSDQIGALHWPGKTPQAARRRLAKLFAAALLERLRPYSRRGSYAWTYHVGVAGHRVLRESGHIEPRARYQPRRLVDYSYVIHDLQLNAWILAYRQHPQRALIEWHGETPIYPPGKAQWNQLAAADPWTAEGLKDPVARPVFPDAVLDIRRSEGPPPWTVLLEHDRTRRVDKNFDKFRRYDRFLTSWHHQSGFARPGGDEPAPYVLFICQDQDQRQLFMQAADHELGGYRWRPSTPSERDYRGRRRILFAVELDIHQGVLDAARLPVLPPGHPNRTDETAASPRRRQRDRVRMRQLHSQSRLPQSRRRGGRHDIPQQQGKNLKPRRSPPSALPIDRPRAPARRSRWRDDDPGPSTPRSKEPRSGSGVAETPSGHEKGLSYGNAQGAVRRLDGVRFPGTNSAIAEVAEVVAARVVEMLEQEDRRPAPGLVTAADVAERLGVCKSWVYANKTRLGAVKLGSGPRARLRFDLDRVVQELGSPIAAKRHIPRGSRRARSRKMALPPDVELLTGRSSR